MSKIVRLSFVLFFMLAMSAIASGQSTVTGAITGLVTNPNREVVPGATVTAKNLETNKEDTATSDDEGRFRVVNLQPGTYTVTVNVSGFAGFTRENVLVEVGRLTPLDVPLAVQGVTGTVEVTSEAPVINTTQQDFTTNINQVSLDNLPSNGRRWSNYALGSPGTAPDGGFGLVSFRGISGLLNNNTVDGGDNNQAFFSEERGRTRISYVIGLASIREFQVNTSNYSAEYGRAAGGVVNAVTKSGTNQFHGSAFYYDRDNKWGARNPRGFQNVLINGVSTPVAIKPADKRQQFGGTIGGPIAKDRLFFFFSYDQQKRNFPGIAVASSPSFFTTVNRAITGSGLKNPNCAPGSPNPTNCALTDAQIDSTVSFLNSLTGPTPRRGDQRILLPKIDWRINDNHTFTATYNRFRWKSPAGVQTAATVAFARQSFGDDFVNVDSLNLRLASTFQPNLVNEARFQWGRDKEFQNSQTPAAGEPLTGPNGKPPQISITNGFTFGKPNFLERKSYPDEKRWQYADTVTLSAGKHTFKWGGDVNYVIDVLDNLFTEEGQYSYSTINDFIVDYANFTSAGALRTAGRPCPSTNTLTAGRCYNNPYFQGFGPTAFKFHTTDVNFFVQDDYRATSRLTLNLGLRYEYERLPTPQVPSSFTNLPGQAIGPDQTKNFPADKNNIGPRLGLAYDLSGNGKSSIRAGYGVYYGRIINSTISNAITNTGSPKSQLQFQLNPTSSTAPIFPNTFSSAAGTTSPPNIVVFAPDMKFPIIHEGDVVFEREIARNTVFSVSYLFAFGHNLPTFIDRNLSAPASRTFTIVGGDQAGQTVTAPLFLGPRPDTRFGAITEIIGNVNTKYSALVLQINRRLTKGLQFDSSYTLSKATDTGQVSQTFTSVNVPFNAFDLAADSGPTNYDIPHKFVASVIWQPKPFSQDSNVAHAIFNGFTIAPIFTAASGPPYSALTSGSVPGVSGGAHNPISSGITGSGALLNRVPLFPRNFFRQPKIVNVDMRVSRRFRIKEKANIEVLAEGFNIFNRTQVTALNTTLYNIGGTATASTLTFVPAFQTLSAAGNSLVRERQVQLAARFEF
jgi:outer membrane receptor protein involved in Fe transport